MPVPISVAVVMFGLPAAILALAALLARRALLRLWRSRTVAVVGHRHGVSPSSNTARLGTAFSWRLANMAKQALQGARMIAQNLGPSATWTRKCT